MGNQPEREAALRVLMQQGFSRPAAVQILTDLEPKVVKIKQAQRRQGEISRLSYGDWLRRVSPEMTWDLPFHKYIAGHIDKILTGELTQLLISTPPRVGKSETVTIRLPVRALEENPKRRIIVGGYNRDLARVFTAESLRIFSQRNPDLVDKESEDGWTTTEGGMVLPAGVGSGVTGRGADLLIVDDPIKSYAEANSPAYQQRVWHWWLNDLRTRRNRMSGVPTIVIGTRWSDNDLIGKILSGPSAARWTVLRLPALAMEDDPLGRPIGESIWPERLPEADLAEMREEMGSEFEALYQQDPVPARGALIQRDWFTYERIGADVPRITQARFWDLASSMVNQKNNNPDFTAGCKMGMLNNDPVVVHVAHMARVRMQPGERDNYIREIALEDGPDVVQVFEEVDRGITESMRRMLEPHGIQVIGVRSRVNKVDRSSNARSSLQMGRQVFEPGPWVADMISEMLRFPVGKHDDQVDAWSGAYNHLVSHSLVVARR